MYRSWILDYPSAGGLSMTVGTRTRMCFSSIGVAVFLLFMHASSVQAQEHSLSVRFDEQTIQRGYSTAFYDADFFVSVPPKAVANISTLTLSLVAWQTAVPKEFAADPSLEFASNIYAYDLSGVSSGDIKKSLGIRIQSKHARRGAAVYFFDTQKHHWERMDSVREAGGMFRTHARFPFVRLAVLQERPWIQNGVINAAVMPARAVGVADAKGAFLFTKDAYEQLPLASITKLMTVLVFLDKNPGWQKEIRIIADDDAEPAKIAFAIGDRVQVKDLFYAALIGSKNNAAKALARSTGLSHEAFVQKMNDKARALGMQQTIFVDVTGLDAGNRSTIEDLLKLARAAFTNLNIAKAASMKRYTLRIIGTKRREIVKSTNFLLADSAFVAMGKTGYINEAGYNFATRVKNKQQEVLVVVLGAVSGEKRKEVTQQLIRFGFRQLAAAHSAKAKKT